MSMVQIFPIRQAVKSKVIISLIYKMPLLSRRTAAQKSSLCSPQALHGKALRGIRFHARRAAAPSRSPAPVQAGPFKLRFFDTLKTGCRFGGFLSHQTGILFYIPAVPFCPHYQSDFWTARSSMQSNYSRLHNRHCTLRKKRLTMCLSEGKRQIEEVSLCRAGRSTTG